MELQVAGTTGESLDAAALLPNSAPLLSHATGPDYEPGETVTMVVPAQARDAYLLEVHTSVNLRRGSFILDPHGTSPPVNLITYIEVFLGRAGADPIDRLTLIPEATTILTVTDPWPYNRLEAVTRDINYPIEPGDLIMVRVRMETTTPTSSSESIQLIPNATLTLGTW